MLSSYRTSTITFPDISPNAFQHPSDKIALNSLQSVPMIDTVQKWLMKNTSERSWNLHVLANSIRLGPSQGADIYNAFEHAASVLDIKELPSIYLMNNPQPNAFASGVDEFAITLTSGLVDALSEDELLGVIGHELGHIKCEHMLYKSLARNLSLIGINLLERYIPGIGSLALSPIKHALLYWSRMAEFSCDRAALLVTQDVDILKQA